MSAAHFSPTAAARVFESASINALLNGFDLRSHYGDGANLWTFAGSNPITRTDPLGLYGWDDDIDDLIADRTGHALYTIGTLNEGARWASIGLSTALDIAGSLLPGSGLYQAFQSVTVLASGGGGFWEALDIATAAFPVVQKGAHAIGGLKSLFKARKWKRLGCGNSFVEGTQVDTPAGPVSIEELKAGTWVLSRPQNDPSAEPGLALVTAVTCSDAPAVLWVTLSNGVLLGMTPEHELWTRQDGWTTAALVQEGDELLDREGRAAAVVAVALDRTPTTAWNLTVQGTETYFVDGVWVHNASCPLRGTVRVHHLLPDKWRGRFERVGLEIDEFTLPIEGDFHQVIHGKGGTVANSWNGAWDRFWSRYPENGPQPRQDEVMTYYSLVFKQFFLDSGL